MDIQELNKAIIDEFRANQGAVTGQFAGTPLLLLTTMGAKSGLPRINPLAFLADNGDHIIFASYAGGPTNPPWYHNLLANSQVRVEVGSESFSATAEILGEPQRTDLYQKMADQIPTFAKYQSKTTRVIPVIRLTRAD
jgi:deazaflavin-dependent oxidoreductase (nitroreductase family)